MSGGSLRPIRRLHLLTVVVCALLIALFAIAGRALRNRSAEAKLRKPWAVFALIYWFVYIIWWNWNGLDIDGGLPLHLCDFNAMVAPLALLTMNRWARATLYFWTFTLSLHAFIQLVLAVGPAHLPFWSSWAGHTIIMASAVYDVAVLGFRPDWRDIGRVPLSAWPTWPRTRSISRLAPTGFIGNPPPSKAIPPFIDAMGPWPQRAVLVMGLAVLGFVLVLLPWRIMGQGVASATEGLDAGKRRA